MVYQAILVNSDDTQEFTEVLPPMLFYPVHQTLMGVLLSVLLCATQGLKAREGLCFVQGDPGGHRAGTEPI